MVKHFVKYVLLLTVLLLVVPAVSAPSSGTFISSSLLEVDNTILKDEVAEYLLAITNTGPSSQKIRLKFGGDIEWIFRTYPLHHALTGIEVPPFSTVKTTIVLSLRDLNVAPKQYRFNLLINSEKSGETLTSEELILNLRSVISGQYAATVTISTDFPAEVDTREIVQLRITLNNRNPRDIENLFVQSKSTLTLKETLTDLEPFEVKVLVQDMTFDPFLPPQDDLLLVNLIYEDNIIGRAEIGYKTKAYSEILLTEDKDRNLLYERILSTYYNDGNVAGEKLVQRKTSLWRIPFTRSVPKAKITREEGGLMMNWDLSLEPQGRQIIQVTQDFRFSFASLLILLIVFGLYYSLRSPLVLKKEARVVRHHEGGISDVKVVLHVKNRTTAEVEDLLITDTVPEIIDVGKKFAVGTIKPDKILKHKTRGTVLRWKIKTLEPLEERIITYSVRAKLSIIGEITLPAYIAKFKVKNKERIITSKKVSLRSLRYQ